MLAAIVGHSIWGFSFMFSKMGMACAMPITMVAYCFAVAFVAIFLKERLTAAQVLCSPLSVMGMLLPVKSDGEGPVTVRGALLICSLRRRGSGKRIRIQGPAFCRVPSPAS